MFHCLLSGLHAIEVHKRGASRLFKGLLVLGLRYVSGEFESGFDFAGKAIVSKFVCCLGMNIN